MGRFVKGVRGGVSVTQSKRVNIILDASRTGDKGRGEVSREMMDGVDGDGERKLCRGGRVVVRM